MPRVVVLCLRKFSFTYITKNPIITVLDYVILYCEVLDQTLDELVNGLEGFTVKHKIYWCILNRYLS